MANLTSPNIKSLNVHVVKLLPYGITHETVYPDASVHDAGAHVVDVVSPSKHVSGKNGRVNELQIGHRRHLARECCKVPLQALADLEGTSGRVHRRQELHIYDLSRDVMPRQGGGAGGGGGRSRDSLAICNLQQTLTTDSRAVLAS